MVCETWSRLSSLVNYEIKTNNTIN